MNKENEIIKELQRGTIPALQELMQIHQDYVFSIALRIVKNREKAEEITQDVFIIVYQKISTYNFRSKFSTWLYTIVYRTSLNYINKKKLALNHEPIDTVSNNLENNTNSYFNNFENINIDNIDNNKILWEAIDRLSAMEGVCITLFYLNQFSIAEISSILKIPVNTVKTQLHRGRKNLKTTLLKKYSLEDII